MVEDLKGTKGYRVRSLFLFSFLEATDVLCFSCASQRLFIYIQEEIIFILCVCIFVFVYFPPSSTNGHILYPPAMPCFFTVYAGERFLSIHSEFLCSLIRLHSSLFREAP